jgi:hypothetical protein
MTSCTATRGISTVLASSARTGGCGTDSAGGGARGSGSATIMVLSRSSPLCGGTAGAKRAPSVLRPGWVAKASVRAIPRAPVWPESAERRASRTSVQEG